MEAEYINDSGTAGTTVVFSTLIHMVHTTHFKIRSQLPSYHPNLNFHYDCLLHSLLHIEWLSSKSKVSAIDSITFSSIVILLLL